VFQQMVAQGLFGAGRAPTEDRHEVDDVGHAMELVEVAHHHHVERRRGGTFLLCRWFSEAITPNDWTSREGFRGSGLS